MQRSIGVSLALLLPLVWLAASCDDDGPSAAERFCEAAAGANTDCDADGCEGALLADCATMAALLNDEALDRSATCLESGGGLMSCLRASTSGLAPSAAHRNLAQTFCSGCALGVSGCEELFFSDADDETARLGAVIVPLGDDLVDRIAAECTSGLTCAATFAACTQTQIATAGVPTEALACLVDEVFLGTGDGDSTCE